MLVDEVEIYLKAGNGGDGLSSFWKHPRRGPDGGNGGKGGDIYIVAVSDLKALNKFASKKNWIGENGENGKKRRGAGKNSKDIILSMPVGSLITDIKAGKEIELTRKNQKILICRGGKGGRGNFEFRSSTNTTPKIAEKGGIGEEKNLKIELRFIADFGFIGLPNAGKSSLLNELTRAKAKVANYAFTTLSPNLGVMDSKVIVDIPGLIEGASKGKGLGMKFLKHIEKVPLLLHCISSESVHPQKDYEVIRQEMRDFNPEILNKKEIILLTKSDLLKSKELKDKKNELKKLKKEVYALSIYDWDSIQKLQRILQSITV